MVKANGVSKNKKLSLSEVAHVEVFKDGNMVLNIFVYDVVK